MLNVNIADPFPAVLSSFHSIMAVPADDIPTFNLKAVVQETGLKPDTLRAWERRYGLPRPERSRGKHRLYSQRDIEILKWLIARQEEGMTISRAVDLWRKLVAEGLDPLQTLPAETGTVAVTPLAGDMLNRLRDDWVAACVAFDEARAEQLLAQAFALYPPETVCLEIMLRGLVAIGEAWHAGRVTVQQEHFASELAMRRLEALIAATQPTRPGRILLGCPPEEAHTFTVLLLSFLLRRRGWHTLYLGANIPLTQFETALEQARPQLVILGAQLLTTAATLADMADLLLELRVPLAFGGLVFTQTPGLVERIPGYYLGHRLEDAPMEVEKLLSAPPPLPKPVSMPPGYPEARSHFLAQVPHIHMRVNQLLTEAGMLDRGPLTTLHLFVANTHMAQSIHAALRLGDLNFLRTDITWIQGLLAERRLPEEALRMYLRAYYQAAVEHLDGRGAVIVGYLRQLAYPDTNNGHHRQTV